MQNLDHRDLSAVTGGITSTDQQITLQLTTLSTTIKDVAQQQNGGNNSLFTMLALVMALRGGGGLFIGGPPPPPFAGGPAFGPALVGGGGHGRGRGHHRAF